MACKVVRTKDQRMLSLSPHPQYGHIELSGVEVVVIVGEDAHHRKSARGGSTDEDHSCADADVSRSQTNVAFSLMEDVRGQGQDMIGVQDDTLTDTTTHNVHGHMRGVVASHGYLGTGGTQHS